MSIDSFGKLVQAFVLLLVFVVAAVDVAVVAVVAVAIAKEITEKVVFALICNGDTSVKSRHCVELLNITEFGIFL